MKLAFTMPAILLNASNRLSAQQKLVSTRAAERARLPLFVSEVRNPAELEPAFQILEREGVEAVVVAPDPAFSAARTKLAELTAKYTTARATAEAAIDRVGAALALRLPSSRSALTELPMARPLAGSLQDQMSAARDGEMATEENDAVRGRLEIGARGASEAEGRIVAEAGEALWPSRPER